MLINLKLGFLLCKRFVYFLLYNDQSRSEISIETLIWNSNFRFILPRSKTSAKSSLEEWIQTSILYRNASVGLAVNQKHFLSKMIVYIIKHLVTDPSGNQLVLFPSNLNVSLGKPRETLRFSGNKTNCFPRDQLLSV